MATIISSKTLDTLGKYEYFTGQDTIPSDDNLLIEQKTGKLEFKVKMKEHFKCIAYRIRLRAINTKYIERQLR